MRLFRFALVCAFGVLVQVVLAEVALAQLPNDMKLEDAGFVMRRADTPEKLSQAKRVPPRRFIARVKNGKRYYIYADPETCQCVFIGNAVAMQAFRDMRAKLQQPDAAPPTGVRPQAILVEDMNDDVANAIGDGDILDLNF